MAAALTAVCLAAAFASAAANATSNAPGQVVFTNSVSGKAGTGTGTFTFGGDTETASVGFTIHCSLSTNACGGAFYVAPFALSGTGNALTISVGGTISGGSGIYTMTLTSPSEVAGCTLTNSGTRAPGGAATTQAVQVDCPGNGTTTLNGRSTATGIVNVT